MSAGHIRSLYERKSYGYILSEVTDNLVYFHFNDFDGGNPEIEQEVIFELAATDWGHRAFAIELVEELTL